MKRILIASENDRFRGPLFAALLNLRFEEAGLNHRFVAESAGVLKTASGSLMSREAVQAARNLEIHLPDLEEHAGRHILDPDVKLGEFDFILCMGWSESAHFPKPSDVLKGGVKVGQAHRLSVKSPEGMGQHAYDECARLLRDVAADRVRGFEAEYAD